MKIPTLAGIIKRRILVNFRADPDGVRAILPTGFRPKLHREKAIVGICLIRLEQIRLKSAPAFLGISSENAAHRIAVEWDEDGHTREGVFIPRRDTSSALNALAGGTLFPGEHNRADFSVREAGERIEFEMRSRDKRVKVELKGMLADQLPDDSIFNDVNESSDFFRAGSLGYSVTREQKHLDGITLETKEWAVRPMAVEHVVSSYYGDRALFPAGSIVFDHALIMQNVEHEWHSAPNYELN